MSREHSKKWCNDYQRAGFKRPSNFLKKIILMANKMNPDWLWANCNMQYWRWWILQNIARASSYLQWGSHLVSNPNIEVLGPYRYFPLQGCASIESITRTFSDEDYFVAYSHLPTRPPCQIVKYLFIKCFLSDVQLKQLSKQKIWTFFGCDCFAY